MEGGGKVKHAARARAPSVGKAITKSHRRHEVCAGQRGTFAEEKPPAGRAGPQLGKTVLSLSRKTKVLMGLVDLDFNLGRHTACLLF